MAACAVDGCTRPGSTRGLCGACYQRHSRRGTLDEVAAAARRPGRQAYPVCCDRCVRQLGALELDGGRGDRPLVAGTMTMAEASAYLLGFYDRRAAEGPEGIDPYIVQRFHELRTAQ